MARQIMKQPDGLWAVYSTIVDGFIFFNATPEELVDFYRQEAADRAEKDCKEMIADVEAGRWRSLATPWKTAVKNHNRTCAPDERFELE